MQNKTQPDITSRVMTEIKSRGIKMKPRIYFAAGSVLLGLGLATIFILAVFVINLTSFRLRMDVPFEFLRFGKPGLPPFLAIFPWPFLLFACISIYAGLKLLKKLDFSYKHNFIMIALITVMCIVGAGLAVDKIGLNERWAQARPLKGLYHQKIPNGNWVMGKIIEVKNDKITIQNPEGQELTIITDNATRFLGTKKFVIGQHIRAFGEPQSGTFLAESIVSSQFQPHPTFRQRKLFSQ
ncbi:hypothetical protein KKB83_04575 [Patescibacteria group bacterium]|nr:hypothetical protein [Patescibacteria group bacterium]